MCFRDDVETEQSINVFNLPIESLNICLSKPFSFSGASRLWDCFSCHIDVFLHERFGWFRLQIKLPKMWRCYVCLALLYLWAVSYIFKCSISGHFLLKKKPEQEPCLWHCARGLGYVCVCVQVRVLAYVRKHTTGKPRTPFGDGPTRRGAFADTVVFGWNSLTLSAHHRLFF